MAKFTTDDENIAKISRSDLEKAYFELQKKYHVLKITEQQQVKDPKGLNSQSQQLEYTSLNAKGSVLKPESSESEKVRQLQHYNKFLRNQVFVLRQQLQSHSRLHAEVHVCFKSTESNERYTRSKYLSSADRKNDFYSMDSNDYDMEEMCPRFLQREVHKLRKELANQKAQFERKLESGRDEGCKVANNVNLIRLKRLLKRQTAQREALIAHADAANKEVQELKKALEVLNEEFEELSKQMIEEKKIQASVETDLNEYASLRKVHKIVLEELQNFKEEREVLKRALEKIISFSGLSYDAKENLDNLITKSEVT